jgi:hypothetical protein
MSILDFITDFGKSGISAILINRIVVWLGEDEERSLSIHCKYLDGSPVWTLVLSECATTEFWAPGVTAVYKGVGHSIEELLMRANKVILEGRPGSQRNI